MMKTMQCGFEMRICFIGPSIGTVNASQETVMYQFANHLNEKHNVTLITGRTRGKPLLKRIREAKFEVVPIPFLRRDTPLNRIINRLSKRMHPWKVESLSLYFGLTIRPKKKRKIVESDVIITYYRNDIIFYSNYAYKFGVPCISILQFAGFGKDFFAADKSVVRLANSRYSKEALEQKHHVKIHGVITPGVSLEFFQDNQPVIPEIKYKRSLLFVGNLRKQKGIFELVEIFEGISKIHEDLILVIVGSGEAREKLMQKIKAAGLSDRIILTGEISYKDMPSYYKSSIMLIHPTWEETFGMVVLEAMASGISVIATDIPALREVTEGAAALLPLKNLNLWVEKIDHLLKDEKTRKEMAEKGIRKAKDHLWARKAEQLEGFLEMAVKQKGKL
jgi:glycosyltransferase involved in cell wall biosynthesis